MLTDEAKRSQEVREPLDRSVLDVDPVVPLDLDVDLLLMNLRRARNGAAGGPSGMTAEHLQTGIGECGVCPTLRSSCIAIRPRQSAARCVARDWSWENDGFAEVRRRHPWRCRGRCVSLVGLFGGCQSALDATLVSPLHGDGSQRRKADEQDAVALADAKKNQMRTYPELYCGNGLARLVVIAGEVGGRWSTKTEDFLWSLASAKAASTTRRLFGSARAAWYCRWCCFARWFFGTGCCELAGGHQRATSVRWRVV